MSFFKTQSGEIYSGDRADENDVQLTDDEAKAYIAETEKSFNKLDLQSQIETLEKNQARALRELNLDATNEAAKTKLQSIENQIVALRTQINNS